MAYSTPRTWVPEEYPTAAQLNQDIRDNQNAAFPLGTDAWAAYAPTNTNITLGNGTQTAKYQRVGRLVVVRYSLVWGSTTSFGGPIQVGLPVAASATLGGAGAAYLSDSATRVFVGAVCADVDATSVRVFHSESGAAGVVNATNPMTWTTNDALVFGFTYEAAA